MAQIPYTVRKIGNCQAASGASPDAEIPGGLNLALAQVRRIVKADHNQVESSSHPKGTTGSVERRWQIVMLAPAAFPSIGGLQRHIEEVASRLVQRGFRVTVLAIATGKTSMPSRSLHKGYLTIGPLGPGLLRTWRRIWQIRGELRKADLVHCHDYYATLLWSAPIRLLGRPIFATFHGHEGVFPVPGHLKFLRRMAVFASKGTLCVGSYLEKWYGTKCTKIILGGVDRSRFRPQQSQRDSGVVLFVGRVEADTGILETLDAFVRLGTDQRTKQKLLVAGSGSLSVSLLATASDHGVEIELLGEVPNLEDYIATASVVIAGGYLSVLEALSMGRDVIFVAQNPLRRDYIRDLEPGLPGLHIAVNSSEIALMITRLSAVPKRIFGLTQGANELNRFSWELVVDEYLNLWRENLGG